MYFCKGKSRYFLIENGKLLIKSSTNNKHKIVSQFEANEVPQTLKQFKVTTEI